MTAPRLIAVLGAECSGKTTLCEALGTRIGAPIVPEYLRQWCELTQRTPAQAEQRHIAAGQLARMRQALRQARAMSTRWVISDGSPLLTAAYSIEYFGDHSLVPLGLRQARRAHLTLLTDPAIDWQADRHLRDGPARRDAVHRVLLGLLRQADIPYQQVTGSTAVRARDCLALLR